VDIENARERYNRTELLGLDQWFAAEDNHTRTGYESVWPRWYTRKI